MIDNVRLPDEIEQGARGGPGFRTTVITLESGIEDRNIEWSRARAQYNIGYGIRKRAHMQEVLDFFYARRGMGRGFLFKDWLDFTSDNQITGYINGEPDTKRLIVKTYRDMVAPYYRVITHPRPETIKVYVNGVATEDFTYLGNGVIELPDDPGDFVFVSCEFDVPARFDTDDLEAVLNTYHEGAIVNVPIVEVKVAATQFTVPYVPPPAINLRAHAEIFSHARAIAHIGVPLVAHAEIEVDAHVAIQGAVGLAAHAEIEAAPLAVLHVGIGLAAHTEVTVDAFADMYIPPVTYEAYAEVSVSAFADLHVEGEPTGSYMIAGAGMGTTGYDSGVLGAAVGQLFGDPFPGQTILAWVGGETMTPGEYAVNIVIQGDVVDIAPGFDFYHKGELLIAGSDLEDGVNLVYYSFLGGTLIVADGLVVAPYEDGITYPIEVRPAAQANATLTAGADSGAVGYDTQILTAASFGTIDGTPWPGAVTRTWAEAESWMTPGTYDLSIVVEGDHTGSAALANVYLDDVLIASGSDPNVTIMYYDFLSPPVTLMTIAGFEAPNLVDEGVYAIRVELPPVVHLTARATVTVDAVANTTAGEQLGAIFTAGDYLAGQYVGWNGGETDTVTGVVGSKSGEPWGTEDCDQWLFDNGQFTGPRYGGRIIGNHVTALTGLHVYINGVDQGELGTDIDISFVVGIGGPSYTRIGDSFGWFTPAPGTPAWGIGNTLTVYIK